MSTRSRSAGPATPARARATTGRTTARTSSPRSASRQCTGSSDPAFRGDRSRYNPEELLVGSLSACHMLWFLHLAADAGIVVTSYEDSASGTMEEDPDDGGHFAEVILRPRIETAAAPAPEVIRRLHDRAGALCYVARSVKFPVRCEPVTEAASAPSNEQR